MMLTLGGVHVASAETYLSNTAKFSVVRESLRGMSLTS